ncbi:EF-hand calcium-binding domain-containing protein 12 [Elysia marginata]|uniref:EF-hand calcium-binding domain-containing protein 12 n=1 Tax=Elysia marginata TaxID=1093978 RepID=A0AAV4GW01_9GAST|nr:EF-hand calcium-binding domain-containing protein 12 [Elysia marginata]
MAPRGRRDILDANISYDLQRLFDPYNFDHIPKEERLKLFKQRDLPHIKHYKAAVKIFGGPPCRTRVIVAPPMETPLKHRLGLYHNVFVPPAAPVLNGSLKTLRETVKAPTAEEKAQAEDDEKVAQYKSWIGERKKLRKDLDNIGLNEEFLSRKPDKTELEKRVQANYKAVRLWQPTPPTPPEVVPTPKPLPEIPTMVVPPPDGLQLLDRFLTLNRMRLMDLFLLADKDKSWSISREELLNAVTSAKIPLTESEVDDIIITLDVDLDDELVYKELNAGLNKWRKQQRELKKQSIGEKAPPDIITNTKGRPTKSIEERAQSQEASMLQGHSRENLNKLVRSTSKELRVESMQKDSVKASKTETDNASRDTRKLSKQSQPDNSSSESQGRQKDSRSKARDSSSQQVTSFQSPLPDSQSAAQTSEAVVSRGLGSREISTSEFASHGAGSRGQIASELVNSETIPLESQQSKSVYEDMLFTSEETPKVQTGDTQDPDTGGEEDTVVTSHASPDAKIYTPPRPCSTKSASGRHSRQSGTSTPNSLEPPDFDVRPERLMGQSAEAMVDLRKHDRVVLSRNNMKNGLTKSQRVAFDELPGVIKIGYKPVDDHCSESTMGGEAGKMVDQFRREKLREYFLVKNLFEETGIPFTQRALDKVLLYPADKPTNPMKKKLALPLGPLTDEWSPFNQPKPKKRSKKKRRGMGRISRASLMGGVASRLSGAGAGGAASDNDGGRNGKGLGGLTAFNGGKKSVGFVSQDDDRSGSGSSKRSYINVEDIYPFAAQVTPKVYKENLSSGRALITRKVDNWMTFEEYTKYTEKLPHRFQHLGRYSNPDAAWPGYLLDKLRLCMDYDLPQVDGHGRSVENRDSCVYEGLGTGLYNGRGHAVFRPAAPQVKRAYPGYNNDLLTWPIGENGVRYGTIDEHRVVK